MNEHLEYLKELEEDLDRVVGFLYRYRDETTKLKNLKYTPNTRVMLKGLKYRLESTDFTKLIKTVERGVNSL
jgi:hypothetical protein